MVEDLIRRARRRVLLNEAFAQSAFAASVTIGGLALLLILGTRFLEWWTIALFAAAGLGTGLWRVYRKAPDPYATAIYLDQNADLEDALSTAFFFSSQTAPQSDRAEEFRRAQRKQAESAVRAVDLDRAAPFTFPRALYAMAALGLLVSGLVALRLRAGRGLDLRAPITAFLFEDQALPRAGEDQKKSLRASADALEKAIDQALNGPENPDSKKNATSSQTGDTNNSADQKPGDPISNDDQSTVDNANLDGSKAREGDEGKEDSQKDAKPSERESLYSKLKDAVSNLLAKNRQENDKSAQQGQKQQQANKSDSKNREKGDDSKDQQQQKSDDQAEGQEAQAEADAEKAQQQAKMNSNSEQQRAQEGDGIGKQDGKKDLREAERLKAMGKISEIIGQRSATVSGETSIEIQSGTQQLSTAYSNTSASHGETEGDVTRDQIPLGLQSYVQQYFQEVRKAAGAQKKKAAQ